MAIIGYGRVSTTDQNPQLQLDALRDAGAARVDLVAAWIRAAARSLGLVRRVQCGGLARYFTREASGLVGGERRTVSSPFSGHRSV